MRRGNYSAARGVNALVDKKSSKIAPRLNSYEKENKLSNEDGNFHFL
jgi:hypothetical protein